MAGQTPLGSIVLIVEHLTIDQVNALQGTIRLNPEGSAPFKVTTWDGRQEYLARPLSSGEIVVQAGKILGALVNRSAGT